MSGVGWFRSASGGDFGADPWAFGARRSPVLSTGGMVACSQPLASAAGIEVLGRGGNAADAAVAMAAALAATEPTSTGIGGDAFCLFFDASDGSVRALNASGRSPAELTLDRALADLETAESGGVGKPGGDLGELGAVGGGGGGEVVKMRNLPLRHHHCVTVPGAAAGWADTVATLGTLPLATVLDPAIRLCERGAPVSPITAELWRRGETLLRAGLRPGGGMLVESCVPPGVSAARDAHGAGEGAGKERGGVEKVWWRAPRAGEVHVKKDLGSVFRRLAEFGKAGFYRGEVAEAMVACHREVGGLLTLEDLRTHESEWVDPLRVRYGPAWVYECPPNGQGLAALEALALLREFGLDAMAPESGEAWHLMVEALRVSFADARAWLCDPSTRPPSHPAPADFLDESYLSTRRKDISHTSRNPSILSGTPISSCGTVSLQVVDRQGNACAFINSNYAGFGTNLIPKRCGFTLQNRGANFDLSPDHPNVLAPKKRPYHTIIPGLAVRAEGEEGGGGEGGGGGGGGRGGGGGGGVGGGIGEVGEAGEGEGAFAPRFLASFSNMGGFMQPSGHVQLMVRLLDWGYDPQTAVDAPRFCIPDGLPDDPLLLEDGTPAATAERLTALHHPTKTVKSWERSVFGRAQAIVRTPDGVRWAGSDGRGDGQAQAQV